MKNNKNIQKQTKSHNKYPRTHPPRLQQFLIHGQFYFFYTPTLSSIIFKQTSGMNHLIHKYLRKHL